MSHGPPQPLSGDFFAFNSQPGSNGGPSVMSNDQAAAAVATMAAQMQQQQQQQQAAQQQQANEDAMMMFFNEQPSAFFDNFEDIPTGLTPQQQQAGVMFPPPQPQQQQQERQQQQPSLAQQQSATSLPLGFGSTGVVSNGGNININNIQITGNNANDDSPSQDTDGVDGTAATLGGANEPGGGPMPVDNFTSGGPNSAAGGAAGGGVGAAGGALTEFTRRKNWPAKVVEELTDLLQIIEPNGRIRYASPNVVTVLGFTPDEMAGQSLTELAHPDDRSVLITDLNACIANASMLRMFVRLRKKDGHYAIVEMVGHAHIGASRFAPNPSNKSPFCQAVFLMSCPYPMKNANLLDSFLEHKMENERLRRRIADLRREEESEDRDDESHAQSQSWVWRQSMDTRSDMASAVASAIAPDAAAMAAAAAAAMGSAMASTMGNNNNNNSATASNNSMSMPPPMTPLRLNLSGLGGMPGGGPNNAALTRENLEGIAARRADSLGDKMARYEGAPGSGNTNASTATNSGTGGTLSTAVAPGSMVTGAPTSAGGGPASAGGGVGGGSKRVPGGNGNGGGSNAASSLPMGTTADTIEMLTGLRYTEGERSRRLSTGNRSPRLIKGDAGIAFSVNRDQRTGDKKKKSRLADEYVCTDCGTLESPEWRKGPSGPKTLCNACGLRWAKKEKREKKKAAANAGVLDGVGMAGSADPVSASGGSPLHHEE